MPVEYSPSITSARIIPSLLRCPPERGKISKSLAQARGLLPKHAVKQVDRLLSNPRLEAWDVFATWVPEMVGARLDVVVAMDWTDFDADGQATLALKLVTAGRRRWSGSACTRTT